MLYRKMPKTGDEISILGFGCMRMPMKDGAIDEPRAIAQIRYSIDNGVNYMDTAWPYHGGASEPLLGRALKDGYREKVKVATKLPTWMVNTREDMDKYLNAQLEKLQTDHIDYYLLHTLNGASWDKLVSLGVFDFIEKAQADGRIVNIGFSFHGTGPDFIRITDAYDWDFCQIQYNIMDREYQAGEAGLEYAGKKGIGVIVMEPLRGGSLGNPTPPKEIAEIWNEADTERAPVEWALRWAWNRPEVVTLLSGMNEEAHIEQNIKIAGEAEINSLTDKELGLVEKAGKKYTQLLKVNCTGCGYCVPCPADVLIPFCFEEYNAMHMFGNESMTRFRYASRMGGLMTEGVTGFASQCTECGVCVEKCPQFIQIPDMLKHVTEEMEGDDLQERLDRVQQFFKQES